MAKKVSRTTAKKLKAELPGARRKTLVKSVVKLGVKPGAKPNAKPGTKKAAVLARALERAGSVDATVLDRLAATVMSRRTADPAVSHSARLLSRGRAKVAQKFGEEAVECLIEAVVGNREALVAESADVLYHLLVLWVDAGVEPAEVWEELRRREGISGIAEKARRKIELPTTKIP